MKIIVLGFALCCLPPAHAVAQANRSPGPQHGTVNVILAQGDSLVVVTDSMLTNRFGHSPTGFKLVKIDDHTICAIAGFYNEGGPDSLEAFGAFIPRILENFSYDRSQESFSNMARSLEVYVGFSLTTHFNAVAPAHPAGWTNDPAFALELTLAGYDLDGSLQVADITFRPIRTKSGIKLESFDRPLGSSTPACAYAAGLQKIAQVEPIDDNPITPTGLVVHKINGSLFCDVAGLPNVAYEMLANPHAHTSDVLISYADAQKTGKTLSAAELRSLAIFLVEQTENSEKKKRTFKVGGPNLVAVLSGGKVVEAPPDAIEEQARAVGALLGGSKLSASTFNCPYRTVKSAPSKPVYELTGDAKLVDVQMTSKGCVQTIDGIVIHDSSFRDSTLFYYGIGPILFGNSNEVVDSNLVLGPNAKAEDPSVQKLICGFKWKAVYQESRELHCAE